MFSKDFGLQANTSESAYLFMPRGMQISMYTGKIIKKGNVYMQIEYVRVNLVRKKKYPSRERAGGTNCPYLYLSICYIQRSAAGVLPRLTDGGPSIVVTRFSSRATVSIIHCACLSLFKEQDSIQERCFYQSQGVSFFNSVIIQRNIITDSDKKINFYIFLFKSTGTADLETLEFRHLPVKPNFVHAG